MSDTIRIAAFGCVHLDRAPRRHLDFALETIERVNPDMVVCLGDLLEGDALSVHDSYADHDALDEIDAADAFLQEVESAAPGAARQITWGNHDKRFGDKVRCGKLAGLLSIERLLQPAIRRGWWGTTPYEKDPDRGVYRVCQVGFTHGFRTGVRSDMQEAIELGQPNGLLVRAHTHRPRPLTQVTGPGGVALPYWCMNVGTLGPLNPEWAHRTHKAWGPAIAVIDTPDRRTFARRPLWRARLIQPPWGMPHGQHDVELKLEE